MKRLIGMVLISVLLITLASCGSASQLIPELPVGTAKAASEDYETLLNRINDLEDKVQRLEQGLDDRVMENNIVQSAYWRMIIENKDFGLLGDNFPFTNDMRKFPTPEAPLYGYDKDKDGLPDTNYVPFEKTVWFYVATGYLIIQGPDPEVIENPDDNRGQAEANETELHNIQTAVMAMLADSTTGQLDKNLDEINDMDLVTADNGKLILSDYLTGLNPDGTVPTGCVYSFALDGTVIQFIPGSSTRDRYETELHNIQTGVMAMLADSTTGVLDKALPEINDLDLVTADGGNLILSNYITGGKINTGCAYNFEKDGTVTQTLP